MSDRRLHIWAEERDNPELRRLARALIDIAIAQNENTEAADPVIRQGEGPVTRPGGCEEEVERRAA